MQVQIHWYSETADGLIFLFAPFSDNLRKKHQKVQDFVFIDLQLLCSLPPDIEVGSDVPTVESNLEDLPSIPGAALV